MRSPFVARSDLDEAAKAAAREEGRHRPRRSAPPASRWLRPQVAVDVGTVNTLVFVPGRGIVLEEPSVIALERRSRRLLAVGSAAEELEGREPPGVQIVHPLHDGVVTDLDAATAMLEAFMRVAGRRYVPRRYDAVVCVPSGATGVEREALLAAVGSGSHRYWRTTLVEEPVAAALGTGADLAGCDTVLVIDIGGGTTEVAAVIGGELVTTVRARSLRVAGNEMDEAIALAIRRDLGLLISERSSEQLKMAFGLSGDELPAVSVGGVDLATSSPVTALVPGSLVAEAVERPVAQIVGSVRALLSDLPPRVAGDVVARGLWLTGGGALLGGIAERFSRVTGIETRVAEDPLRCVVRGLAAVLAGGSGERHAA